MEEERRGRGFNMGWQECVNRLSGTIRTISFFHKDKGESVKFAKFSHSESERELRVIQNGSVQTSMPRDTSGCTSDGDGWDSFEYVDEISEQSHQGNPRERISEWQAGWNVTNAIQVTITIYFIHHSGKLKLSFDRTTKNISQ